MPRRNDIQKILVVGAGPIIIGQACEFDYSGTQACKSLKAEGYEIVLVNSNPATIMTDFEIAHHTYIEPITASSIQAILEKEKCDAILPTVGGQTALNVSIEMYEKGILGKLGVEMIGANYDAIKCAEDRELFRNAMTEIGIKMPLSGIATSIEEAETIFEEFGLPLIIRPSFTLGGRGGGIAYTKEDFKRIVASGLKASATTQVLIDKSLIGWKEYEMEVIRDKNDNAIIVCSIENIDPMGVHTGDSITVAPALTLTDKEYQEMRNDSLAVLRKVGVETGGSNVQFAVNPENGERVVIEMNPRVSRSSALASKATGFPIASVAAKLAIGYSLDEIKNDITQTTPASFEPSIDYIVTKIPRFAFEKFRNTDRRLSSAMKSVGEVMSISTNFPRSLQKALMSSENGLIGFNRPKLDNYNYDHFNEDSRNILVNSLSKKTHDLMLIIAEAFRQNFSIDEIYGYTSYDPWFLHQIQEIILIEKEIESANEIEKEALWKWKIFGFGDEQIAKLRNNSLQEIREYRKNWNIQPVYKKIDSCAGEFSSGAQYFYSSYIRHGECEANPSNKKKVIILGSGPNRIGQGIEFDYACTQAAIALRELNVESIMVNCNPETVSTDYDTANRLYFEPITAETVLDIIDLEKENGEILGVIVQFGGQTPLKLIHIFEEYNIPILGTSSKQLDIAEDRNLFGNMIEGLGIAQPKSDISSNDINELREKVANIGYPLVIRPSYVLGGQLMSLLYDENSFEEYVSTHADVIQNHMSNILIDKFLENGIEVDVDVIRDSYGNVFVAGIMEHIEEAGIHSGDSACTLPTYSLSDEIVSRIRDYSINIANELEIVGLMNAQYVVQDNNIYVIEVNPRASRTTPFVVKATGAPIIQIATLCMVGQKSLNDFDLKYKMMNHVAVKESVFPFDRFGNEDTILGPEMKSTGEVMGIDKDIDIAFAKAQISAGMKIPMGGKVFISVKDSDKPMIVEIVNSLLSMNFEIYATGGTANYLQNAGVLNIQLVHKVYEDMEDNIVTKIGNNEISLVINTSYGNKAIQDSESIRQTALLSKTPCVTTIRAAKMLVKAIFRLSSMDTMPVCSIQEYNNIKNKKT